MQRGSRLLVVFLAVLGWLATGVWTAGAQAAIELHIDGRLVTTEPALALLGLGLGVSQPVLQHDLGVLVDDATFPVVTLTYGTRTATVVVDDRRAVVDGRRVELQVAPELRAGVLYVPLHLIADMVGLRVDWDVLSGTLRLDHRTPPSGLPLPGSAVAADVRPATASAPAAPGPEREPAPAAVPPPDQPRAAEPQPEPGPEPETLFGPTAGRVTEPVPEPASPPLPERTMQAEAPFPSQREESGEPPDLLEWLDLLADSFADPAPAGATGEAPAVLYQVDLRVDGGRVVLEVAADKPVSPRAMFLPNPDRLVVDVPDAVLGTGWRSLPGDGRIVEQLRTSATEDGGVRLVADLTAPTGYRLQMDPDGRSFVVQLNQQLRAVSVVPTAVGGLSLELDVTGPVRYSAFVLREPARVVIDLTGATVSGPQELPGESQLAAGVRVSQYAQDVVRVVVELRGTTTASLFSGRFNGVVEGEAQPGADGRVALVLNPLTGLAVERSRQEERPLGNVLNVAVLYSADTEFVLIESDAPLEPALRRLREPERLVVDLPGTQVARSMGLAGSSLRDGVVAAVRAGQAEPGVSRIVVELSAIAEHHLMVSSDGRRVVLALRPSQLAGRTIVVDPGHGGRDPGAIGYSGTYEKDVTLAIGLLVANMLEKAGATVIMTRHEDATVELAARTALANAVGADAFVSIHADAVGFGRIASGSSTFYYPENGNSADASLNRRYAEAVHAEVLGQLGLNDRGVHERALYVVRNTVMPSALVEVGFIDNPDEEKLLLDPDFQARAAAGIVQGIVRFFSEEQQLDVPPAQKQWQLAAEDAVGGFLEAGEMPAEALALAPMALLSAVPEPQAQDTGF